MIDDQIVNVDGREYCWRYDGVEKCPPGFSLEAWCPDQCWGWSDSNYMEVAQQDIVQRLRDVFLENNVPQVIASLDENEVMRFACLLSMMGVSKSQVLALSLRQASNSIDCLAHFVGIQDQVSVRGKGKDAIYVIKLSSEVRERKDVKKQNPNASSTKDCVYVGMTGLSPEERFKNHQAGHKGSKYTKGNYSKRLLPELTTGLHNLKREDAAKIESLLAEELRRQGYAVTGGR